MPDIRALLAPIRHLHERIRKAVVEACDWTRYTRGNRRGAEYHGISVEYPQGYRGCGCPASKRPRATDELPAPRGDQAGSSDHAARLLWLRHKHLHDPLPRCIVSAMVTE